MKKSIIIGSIFVVVLLVLTMFPNVVSEQISTTPDNKISNISYKRQIKNHFQVFITLKDSISNNEWYPGYVVLLILNFIVIISAQILQFFLSGFYNY